MKRFGIIFSREFRETLRSKPFIIISVFMLIIIAALAFLSFIPAASEQDTSSHIATEQSGFLYTCALSQDSDEHTANLLAQALPYINLSARVTDDISSYDTLLDRYDAILVLRSATDYDCYEKLGISSQSIKYLFDDALTQINRHEQLTALGVSSADVQNVLSTYISGTSRFVGDDAVGQYLCNYIVVILLFLSIALYGQMVASRVVSEKGSRTMEILVTCADAKELLYGKVLGVGAAGLLQLSVFSLSVLAVLGTTSKSGSYFISSIASVFSPTDIIYLCLYFLLGFLLMAFLYGGIGALTERQEDLSGIANIPIYFFMAGYLIAVFAGTQVTVLMRFASFFPFWSPVVMFSRMALEEVPSVEVAISAAILALSCLAAAKIAVKLYRRGMFLYGISPKLSDILKTLRSHTENETKSN